MQVNLNILIWFIFIAGISSVFCAVLCFFTPSLLEKMQNFGQRTILNLDKSMVKKRFIWGALYLILGTVLLYLWFVMRSLS